ncbi:hypothetical protein [Burkholderia sp. MSMB1498]|uniref:hypothetical protein n=1 Tax=Burkholderia sp. MSMB1498 TaxID=1637842 RepID=UPI000759C88D|nr:hypothetical protein [Burkholderia sp. MSMB1498]KVK89769.1 hypothetical protein WS91_28175 [Burkholderia sp. MSMB1498]
MKTMTTGARLRESYGPCAPHAARAPDRSEMSAGDAADAFCAWLDAGPGDARPPRTPADDAPAIRTNDSGDSGDSGDSSGSDGSSAAAAGSRAHARRAPAAGAGARLDGAPAAPRPSPADVLTLRIANGPLAGLTLRARFAGGALVVALDSGGEHAHLRARARRMRGRLEAALAARFAQPVTLEWSDAAAAD